MATTSSQISCCVFDLETSSLNADFGIVLCACVKPAHGAIKTFRGDEYNKDWSKRRSDDSALVAAIVDELSHYDVWIAHNGRDFDVKFLRTRLARWDLPQLPNTKLLDPLWLARNKLKMSYNSLDQLAQFLGCNSKTRVDGDQWLRAALDGDRKSMDYITRHCQEDVRTLERIVGRLKGYSTNLNSWGSGY